MGLYARVLADSISPLGDRLVTFEASFWRSILAEVNTHRVLSRNSASSRAVPVVKQIRRLLDDSFEPSRFGINQPGMQSYRYLEGDKDAEARRIWRKGRDRDILTAVELLLGERLAGHLFGATPDFDAPSLRETLMAALSQFERDLKTDPEAANRRYLNVHKQFANRRLECDSWHTAIITATEWSNFFALRLDHPAQPQFRELAEAMKEALDASTPRQLGFDEWHLPLVENQSGGRDYDDWVKNPDTGFWAKVSAGRCARVSYLTHGTAKRDLVKDTGLHDSLAGDGHMSPLEHQARPMTYDEAGTNPWSGNFRGWVQYRKTIPHEDDFGAILALKAAS